MTGFVSGLYVGSVAHSRLKPVRHRLRYRMPALLLDLDELPRLAAGLRLFSVDRFNLWGFYGRDHLAGTDRPLRAQVEAELAQAGLSFELGAIRLLCMPRVLGGVFNPLSLFFCHGMDGALRAVLYEVNNTFGQRHRYILPITDPGSAVHRQACRKDFPVSPFLDMALEYRFRLAPPGSRVTVAIEARDAAGPVLAACFAGQRQELSDAVLLRQWFRYPALSLHVLGGIHWEAFKLWRKGLRLHPRPAVPERHLQPGD
jgi:hypothetical protein